MTTLAFGKALRAAIAACALSLPALAAGTADPQAHRLPVEVFANLPGFDDPTLSPDGGRIAFAIQIGGHVHVLVQKLDRSDRKVIPPVPRGEISGFRWASEKMLLVQYGASLQRLAFRARSHETRTLSFNVETGDVVWLGKPKVGMAGLGTAEAVSQHESIVDMLPDDPDHILMAFDFDLSGTPAVYKVDIATGRRTTAQRSRTDIQDWYTDQHGTVRLGSGTTRKGPEAVFKDSDGKWQDLKDFSWSKTYDVAGFTGDPHSLYVSGPSKHGTLGLYKLDLATGKIVDTVYENPSVDASGFVDHPVTGQPAGTAYTDDLERIRYLDKDLDLIQRSLHVVLPDTDNTIVSKARDKELYLVLAKNDRTPGDYYIYDRSAHKLAYVASRYRLVQTDDMAPTHAVSIPVRDGSSIPGYLTLPKGHADARGLPAVILPHGGPIGIRDDAEWDYMAQFMANRGYAVLKPNFRGSGGYGRAFEHAGKLQWGGLMQDDVTDATKWLIEKGGVDAKRVCIVGGSYGGYAALMGTIKAPGLYRCAVSINGVTDLPEMKFHDKKFVGGTYWVKSMGLEGADDESVSPIDRAAEISAPILLISAKDDTVVPNRQSRDLDKKLHKLKKPSRYVEIKTGEHGLVTAEARKTALTALGDFLDHQIGHR